MSMLHSQACSACGGDLPSDAKFCPECGANVTMPSTDHLRRSEESPAGHGGDPTASDESSGTTNAAIPLPDADQRSNQAPSQSGGERVAQSWKRQMASVALVAVLMVLVIALAEHAWRGRGNTDPACVNDAACTSPGDGTSGGGASNQELQQQQQQFEQQQQFNQHTQDLQREQCLQNKERGYYSPSC